MDCSIRYSLIAILAQIFVLLNYIFLLSTSNSALVKAQDDKTIVRTICTQTLEPDACVSCVLSDSSRATSNMTDLVHSVLFCLYSEATYAHQSADHLFQNTAAVRLKKAFQVCKDTLFSASNTLIDGLTKLEGSDYEKAHLCALGAQSDLFKCGFAFRKYADYVPIATELLNHMVQAKRLFEVAQFMFLHM